MRPHFIFEKESVCRRVVLQNLDDNLAWASQSGVAGVDIDVRSADWVEFIHGSSQSSDGMVLVFLRKCGLGICYA
jgi:hypothetical protein